MKHFLLFLLPLFIIACNSSDDGSVKYTGIVDVNSVRVSAETQGRILNLKFDEGHIIDSGSVLLTVEPNILNYQLNAQSAGIDEVNNTYQAAAQELEAATLNRDNLKQKLSRLQALLKSNAVTQQQVDDVETQLNAADKRLDGAKMNLAAIQSRKRQMESTMDVTREQIQKTTLAAPQKGTVLVRYVETGELVMPGSPICEIANLNDMWTKIYVSEMELPNISLGQHVTVNIDGKENAPLEGTVSWISSESEFTPKTILTEETRTTLVYAVKVRIPNNEGMLKIGMPVTVVVKGR